MAGIFTPSYMLLQDYQTALLTASMKGNLQIIVTLLDSGADINGQDAVGYDCVVDLESISTLVECVFPLFRGRCCCSL